MNLTLRRTVAVAALVLAPVASSCGFDRATDQVYNPGVGVNDRSGSVDVLNALVVSGADGSGSLVATLANNDTTEGDALTGVTGADDAGLSISLGSPLEVPRGGSVSVSDEAEVSVRGDRIVPGRFVAITFTFERGEAVTLEVPVVARRGPYADIAVPSVAPTTATPDEESSSSH